MLIAREVSDWSKDPRTSVGAVIVDRKRRIVATGYNGFPRGVKDRPHLYFDRAEKHKRVVHAELNAILNSVGSVEDCILYTTLPPCCECAKAIIQSGIRMVCTPSGASSNHWMDSMIVARSMLSEAGIPIHTIE